MNPTVSAQPLREERSSDREKVNLVNGLRTAANLTTRIRPTLTTTGTGVFTLLWQSEEIPEGVAWTIEVLIVGRGLGARCQFGATALYYREPAGVATLQGAVTMFTNITSDGALSASFGLIGNTATISVLDNGVITMNWDALVEIREVS
jgi:hypothetical protein